MEFVEVILYFRYLFAIINEPVVPSFQWGRMQGLGDWIRRKIWKQPQRETVAFGVFEDFATLCRSGIGSGIGIG